MNAKPNGKHVVVVGSGLGGISAALSLALEGFRVSVHEKNRQIGGKLNQLVSNGYTFDLGPSILTLPHVFAATFEKAGRKLEDYVPLRTVRPHWRNFFEDGTVVDLAPETDRIEEEARKVGEPPENVKRFLAYSGKLYDLVNRGYFEQGLDSAAAFRDFYGLTNFLKFDLFRSMHGSVKRHFATSYYVDIFDFFIKYVGSSAYRAPAFMNCLPTIQYRHDLWYVDGGLYGLARGLEKLMRELDIGIHLQSEVERILVDEADQAVRGIRLAGGTEIEADYVVSNMEILPAYRRLLQTPPERLGRLPRLLEPACSGLVIDIGLDRKYEQLAHHNFFFSGNQRRHFRQVFVRKEIPRDPTLYVVAASRTDPTVAPKGCDGLKILPHIPPLDPDRPVDDAEYVALKERVYDKLERMGCENLRRHVVFEHFWTPRDIEKQYLSNGGSIYGVVSDRFKNLAFKGPKASSLYRNLYFTGGSVNPGGGMPMVFLCGQNVARMIASHDRRGVG